MNPQFTSFVKASRSVTAAHTILRAIADRGKLTTDNDIMTYVTTVADADPVTCNAAIKGLRILSSISKKPLAELPDEDARRYIIWLADFAISRASAGKVSNPDVGRTLLAGLRQMDSTMPPGNEDH